MKRKYEKPQFEVIKIRQIGLIATSTPVSGSATVPGRAPLFDELEFDDILVP